MSQEQAGKAAPRRIGCLGRTLYIVLIGLVIIGFAAGSIYLLWYQPVVEENQALQAEVDELRPLLAENDELRSEVQQAAVRLIVLQTLVDVNAARASLALGQPEPAMDSLSSAGSSLEDLARRVGSDQATDVNQMRDRLGLALGELATDAFAAQSDLDVLANDLSQLAEALEQ
jgi:phosphoglycerate-specific signal transduction histidine kinase